MKHLKGNIIAAIDVETTGTTPGYHEIIQIAVVPLGPDLKPLKTAFYTNVRPEHLDRADPQALAINRLTPETLEDAKDQAKVADLLVEFIQGLKLPVGGKIIPLVHNWPFELGFLTAWLGRPLFNDLFHYHPRDAMSYALAINDRAALHGKTPPFKSVGLAQLCEFFKITNGKPHDALYDCLAEIEVYRALLQL